MSTIDYPDNGYTFKEPSSISEVLEDIRQKSRIAVPSKLGGLAYPLVVSMEAPAVVDGVEVVAVIVAKETNDAKEVRFALCDVIPETLLSIPALYVTRSTDTGTWLKKRV